MADNIIIFILVGVGLSAAVGFRVFIPFLVLSILSIMGHVKLTSEFQWIASYPALIVFGAATLFEIGGYFVPWLDNILDTIATPIAVIAGAIIMASVLSEISPLLKWSLAIIAGGGIAGTVQSATGLFRAGSTATTGGLANPVFSATEAGVSFGISTITILLPVLAFIVLFFFLYWITKKYGKKLLTIKKRQNIQL
jgi:hypothetical protein